MAKEETLSVSKDLQRKLSLLIESIQNNSKVVAFMESPIGQYLDRHPFAALTLLVFVAVSAVPVGFFLLVVVLTSLAAFVGVILLEGLVICVGGLSLLCVLCGLGFVSLVMSGTITVSYMVVSSLANYWFSSSPFVCHLVATRKLQRLWRHQLHSRQDEGRKKTSPPSPIDPGPVYQTSDTKLQWRLPAGYEVRRLTGALPGLTSRTEPELFSSHLWKVVGSYGPRGIMTQALPECAP